jgi:hypothetical protein
MTANEQNPFLSARKEAWENMHNEVRVVSPPPIQSVSRNFRIPKMNGSGSATLAKSEVDDGRTE